MDYQCVLIAIILTSTTPRSSAITSHHNFRRHADPPPTADWEWALREATYQTLLRERYSEPSLHDYIFDAPMTGRTHGASPFGDVAVLARGQLYLTQSGFHFVQDPNAYDCDYCSSTIESGHRPIAIWVVRRIRHRDVNGHRYEIEYTVSPVRGGDFATENGNYNYALPGHVFVVVTNANSNDRRKYQNQNQYEVNEKTWNPHRGYLPVKADVGENRDRHYLPPYTTPSISYDYHQPGNKINDKGSLERELELYKKLVQSLAMRAMGTTTPRLTTTMTVPSTHATASDFDIFEEVKPLTAPVTVKTTQAPTPALDVTTIVHLAKPMITSRPRQTTTVKSPVVFPTTPFIPSPTYVIYSEPDPLYSSTLTTTNQQTKPPPMFTTTTWRSTTTTSRSTTKKSIPTYRRKVSVALPMVQATTTRRMKTTTTSSIAGDIFDSFEPAEIRPQLPSPDIMDTTHVTGSTSATIKPTQPIKTTKKTTVAKTTKTKQEVVTKATIFKKPITKETKKPLVSTEETSVSQPTKQIFVTIEPLPTQTITEETTSMLSKVTMRQPIVTERTTTMLSKVTTTKQPIVTERTTPMLSKVTMSQPIVTERTTPMLSKVTMMQPIVTERTTSMLSKVTMKQPIVTGRTTPMLSKVTMKQPIVTERTTTLLNKVTTRQPIVSERTTSMLSKVTMKQPIVTERTTPMLSKVTMKQPIVTERTTTMLNKVTTRQPIVSERTTSMFSKVTTTKQPIITERTTSTTSKTPKTPIEDTTTHKATTVTKITTMTNKPPEDEETTKVEQTTEGTESTMTRETEELTHQTIETTNSTTLENKTEQPKDQTTETPTSKQTSQTDTTSFTSTQITEEISDSPTTDMNDTESPQTDETTTITEIPTTTKPNSTAKTTQKTLDAVDEIFGELITETKPTTTSTSKPNTKEIDELFDDKPKKSKKRLVLNSIRLLSTATTAPKIIYSNFYAAAPDDEDFTTETENTVMEPRTIQSYSTSISFKVNKNATSQTDEDVTVRAKVVEVGANDSEYAVFKAELPDVTTVAAKTTADDRETTKVFDKIALSLVNHARSLDYVNAKDGDRKKKRKSYNSKYRSLGKN